MLNRNCIIKFVDGSELIIENITTYKIDKEERCVIVEVGDLRNFFNFDQMQYICTESCLNTQRGVFVKSFNEEEQILYRDCLVKKEIPDIITIDDKAVTYRELLEMLERERKAGIRGMKMEWISVKDRLPDKELQERKAEHPEYLLESIEVIGAIPGYEAFPTYYDGNGFKNVFGDKDRPEYWMPMPESPKKMQ